MELELAGAKEPELAREIRVGKQLHGFQDAAQTRSGDDMHNGTIVAGDGDKRTAFGGADGCCRLTLEVLNAVCILHRKKVYFNRVRVKIAEVARPVAHFDDSMGRAEVSAWTATQYFRYWMSSDNHHQFMKQTFKARLSGRGPNGAWTFLPIPFDVEKEFGSRARVAIAGTINNYPFRNTLMPEGDGTHSMMVNKALQAGARASAGDLVAVVMDVDKAVRKVVIQEEFRMALKRAPAAREFFEQLSYSRQKEFTDWIADAKRPETKSTRVGKSIERLLRKEKLR
jgi:Bacteriocin-protection, YdeI or OmpD-Associated/Domain of unknown function (DUF1905)